MTKELTIKLLNDKKKKYLEELTKINARRDLLLNIIGDLNLLIDQINITKE